jgi:hypothetical protein
MLAWQFASATIDASQNRERHVFSSINRESIWRIAITAAELPTVDLVPVHEASCASSRVPIGSQVHA